MLDNFLPIQNFYYLYLQPNISDLSYCYVLKIVVQGVVRCVEKVTTVVTFLNYCWEFEIRNSVFHVGNSTLNNA